MLLITLSRGRPDFAEQTRNVITHYNKAGKAIEIEILSASEMVAGVVKEILARKSAAA